MQGIDHHSSINVLFCQVLSQVIDNRFLFKSNKFLEIDIQWFIFDYIRIKITPVYFFILQWDILVLLYKHA